jgi:hypothetical protein
MTKFLPYKMGIRSHPDGGHIWVGWLVPLILEMLVPLSHTFFLTPVTFIAFWFIVCFKFKGALLAIAKIPLSSV